MDERSKQEIIDAEHLRLLRIGYFISSGFTAFFALMGLMYAAMGALVGAMAAGMGSASAQNRPPPEIAWIFGVIGVGITLIAVTAALLKFRTAQCLERRTSRGLCLVTAALSCLEMPYGTTLGIFTFIVLSRPSVRQQFERPADRG